MHNEFVIKRGYKEFKVGEKVKAKGVLSLIICLIMILSLCNTSVFASNSDEYKTFTQTDERWGTMTFGTHGSSSTIKAVGCALTSTCILMAYANPDLRDAEKWNPGIASQKFSFAGDCIYWGSTLNVDSTFTFVTKDYQNDKSFSTAEEAVVDALNNGYYVEVFSKKVTSCGHYSPVVGIDGGKPVVWDVAGSGLTWDDFNSAGINNIVVYESSLNSSKDTLNGSVGSEEGTTDDMKERARDMMYEWEALGKSSDDRYFLNNQEAIQLLGRENLSQKEQFNLEQIEEGMNSSKKSYSDWFSITTMFIGLVLLVYSILMFVCSIVDRVNEWIDISLVGLLSFGRCRLKDKEDDEGFHLNNLQSLFKSGKGYVSLSQWVSKCIVVLIIGVLMLSRIPQLLVSKIFLMFGGR